MNVSSISALSASFNALYSSYDGYAPAGLGSGPNGSTSVTKIPDGSTVTTLRADTGAIISVTTARPAAPSPLPQNTESTVDVIA